MISYQEFCKDQNLLGRWHDAEGEARQEFQTASDIASFALWLALVKHADESSGVIDIHCETPRDQRAVRDLLEAYLEQPLLAKTRVYKRGSTDLNFSHGVAIVIHGNAFRKPAHCLEALRLPETRSFSTDDITPRNLLRCLFALIDEPDAEDWKTVEEIIGYGLSDFIDLEADLKRRAVEHSEAVRASWRSAMPTYDSTPRPPGIDGRDYYSEEWELRQCERRELRDIKNAPRVVRERPR